MIIDDSVIRGVERSVGDIVCRYVDGKVKESNMESVQMLMLVYVEGLLMGLVEALLIK